MRVGFTGAQGTGKTTLLKAINKNNLDLRPVPSTAREALKAGFNVNRDADPLSQLVTTVSRITLEDRLYHNTGRTISDRTPLDSLAYTCYQMHNVWDKDVGNEYYWSISKSIVVQHMWKYDHIFYFPPFWKPKADGVRDDDEQYQRDIDSIIVGLLDTYNIEYHTMPRGTTEQRLDFLTKAVN